MTETPVEVDYIAQAELVHENGPFKTPPSTLYFTYLKPDGESIVAPATSAEVYLREGFTITGEQTIENYADWSDEQSAKASKAAPKDPAPGPAPKAPAAPPRTAA